MLKEKREDQHIYYFPSVHGFGWMIIITIAIIMIITVIIIRKIAITQ